MRLRTLVPAVAFVGALLLLAVAASPLISPVSLVHAQSGAPVFDSSADYTRSIDENQGPYETSGGGTPSQADRVLIGDPVTATGAGVTYTLDNSGASDFGIDFFTGQIMAGNPLDYEEKSSHTVTVIAVNSSGTARQDVTINVNNLDEPGTVTLMWKPSGSDVEFEAKLSDGDVVTGTPTWQWSESDSQNGTYTNISSATSATYTNSSDHEYLKATATYTDSHGSGKTRSAIVGVERSSRFPTGYELEFGVNTSGGYACPHYGTDPNSNYDYHEADLCLHISRNATPEDDIYYPARVKYAHDTESDRSPSRGTISYSLSGADAAKFNIDPTNGALFPKGTHQYNSPGTDEVFLVTITATHPSGGDDGTDSVDIALKPSGSNTNPVVQGPQRIRYPENGTWQVATYTGKLPGRDLNQDVGWLIGVEPGGGDGDFFDIDDNGVLHFDQPPDYEQPTKEFSFTLMAYDTNPPGRRRSGTTYYSVRVIVYNVDEDLEIRGPTVVEFPENSTGPIHTYTAEGTEGSLTWMLEGQDKQWFSLSSSGALSFRNTPDYEAPFDSSDLAEDRNDYLLSITVMDDQGTTDTADDDSSKIEPVRVMVTNVNEPPEFEEGSSTTRNVSENAGSGEDVGDAVKATDPDAGDSLSYDLTGNGDDASFDIGTYDGQLQTISGVDYGSKSQYTVTITVTDGGGLTDEITVTVNSTEVNDPPVFDDATLTTTLSLPENTAAGQNVGDPVTATDEDNPTLTYTLEGTTSDKDAFTIDNNGQIKTKTGVTYNYEDPGDADTSNDYQFTVKASDGNSSDTIEVTVDVTNVNEPPEFEEGSSTTRNVSGNAQSGEAIGDAVEAADPDAGDSLSYDLTGSGDDASFDIGASNGQLQTISGVDYGSKSRYTVTITVTDGGGLTDEITVTINSTEVRSTQVQSTEVNDPPVFTDATTTREVPENSPAGTNAGSPVTATDEDKDSLTYTLEGTHASSFQIGSTSGQIKTKTGVTYDYEGSRNSYSVTVKADDKKGGTDTIGVTIDLTNVDEDGAITFDPTQPKAGTLLTATLADASVSISGKTWEWSSSERANSGFTTISGQSSDSYTPEEGDVGKYLKVRVSYTDGHGSGKSAEATTSAVIAANTPPTFPGGDDPTPKTLSVAENSAGGTTVGTVAATESDTGDTLIYSLGGSPAEKESFESAFSLDTSTGRITVRANDSLDHETTDSYTFEISVSDGKNSANASDAAVDATVDVTITVTDVNEPPAFDTTPNTRAVVENTGAGRPVGDPFTATDPDDGDTLTYVLGGDDKDSFSIQKTSDGKGQIKTKTGVSYNHEAKETYSVTVSVHDGKDLDGYRSTVADDNLAVTITVTDVNETPTFDDNFPATRLVKENTHPADIGAPISATDPDNENGHSWDTLTYTLGGTDASSFGFDTSTGQIKTKAALDRETKSSYSVTVTVTDGRADDGTTENPPVADDTITVSITVTDENDAPTFTDGSSGATRSIPENTSPGQNIGTPVGATDAESNTLTYTLEGTDKSHFNIVSTSGQLQTKGTLDYEDKSTYNVTVRVNDNNGNTPTIGVTINVTDVNDAPAFDDGATVTRDLPEQTGDGTEFGDAITATDDDPADTLTYTLGGADASSFQFDTSTKKLKTKTGVTYDYESTKKTYTVTISVTDSRAADGTAETPGVVDDTITVTNVDEEGTVTFDHPQPEARSELTATLADPDIVSGTPSWQWSKSDTMDGTFSEINNAASASYTPADSEVDKYLKATATYKDRQGGSGVTKTASGVAHNPVQAFHNPNEAPTFHGAGNPPVFTIEENTSPGEDIGKVSATDPNNEAVAYSLDGASARVFVIGLTSGLIQTKGPLDYESKSTYAVTVFAKDPQMLTGMMTVTINVTDVNDPGTVSFSSTQPRVQSAFTASLNDQDAGRANESWQWALSDTTDRAGDYTDITNATSATYTPVAADEGKYLKATVIYDDKFVTGETISAISEEVVGSPLPTPPGNIPNGFPSTGDITRSVPENTGAGQDIGSPVEATDMSNGPLTYTLGGADGSMFGIDSTDGQLLTKEPLDYEAEDQYTVVVTATDQLGAQASTPVSIVVTDVDEPPGKPDAPTVAPASTDGHNTLAVVWEEPHYTGPAITSYDVQYREEDTTAWRSDNVAVSSGGMGTSATISDLSPSTTYEVRVRARNDEGTGKWSDPGTGTSAEAPVVGQLQLTTRFLSGSYSVREGESVTIDVGLSPPADREATIPISATGGTAEAGDYTLSATKVTFTSGASSRSFTVTANQDIDTATETVSLGFGTLPGGVLAGNPSTATLTTTEDDPPAVQQQQPPPPQRRSGGGGGGYSYTPSTGNRAPVFMEGATSTRLVPENSPLGTIIFPPVLAVDPDQHTLTYTVADADRAHFRINRGTAELTTGAVFDYESGDSYTVTVFVTDGRGGRDSIVVLISVTDVGEIGYDPATKAIALITVEDGGSVTTPDGSGSVVFPAGTRSVPFYARIGQGSSDCAWDAPKGDLHVYTTVDLLDMDGNPLEGLTLDRPVTILLRVNAADLGGLERALQIHEHGGFRVYTRTDSGEDWTEVDFTLFSSDTGAITAFIPGIRDFSCFVVVVDGGVLPPPVIQVIAAPRPAPTPVVDGPPQAAPAAPTPAPPAPEVKQGPPIYPPVGEPEEADDPLGPEAPLFTFRTIWDFANGIPLWLLIVLAIAAGAWAAILRAWVAWRRNHPPPPKYRNNKPELGRDLLVPNG